MNRKQRRKMSKDPVLKTLLNMAMIQEEIKNHKFLEEGTKVKINRKRIERVQTLSPRFEAWLNENEDKVFTVEKDSQVRYGFQVCLKEDKTVPKWLFEDKNLIVQNDKNEM